MSTIAQSAARAWQRIFMPLAALSVGLHLLSTGTPATALEPASAQSEQSSADTSSNPYLPPADYTPEQLGKYLDKLLNKPESIRARPGYREGVLDTAARILAAEPGAVDAAFVEQALLARLDFLAQFAREGDSKRVAELRDLADAHAEDQRAAVAAAAQQRRLECRVLYGDPIDADLAPELLAELKAYFAKTKLEATHLRLASASVGLINLLPDREQAKQLYSDFGELFAKSSDRKLARYGQKIAGGDDEESLIGKPLELAGNTVEGAPFDWSAYRGKVVLVDFWATWCGPCRGEIPHLKEAYQRFHEAGFEVVGISLDRDRETLETFLADEQIPWVNLFDEAAEGQHPLAEKYNIRAIPTTFLVGRDGQVIAQNLRGPALAERLAKLFADGEPPASGK